MRAVCLAANEWTDWPCELESALLFLVAGEVRIRGPRSELLFSEPGTMLAMAASTLAHGVPRWSGAAKLIALTMADFISSGISVPDDCRGERSLVARMYSAGDGESYFRDFPELFDFAGLLGPQKAMVGLRIYRVEDGFDYTWHPEVVNNLVLVLSGGLELEVGGGSNRVQFFGPGSICLAEDRVGRGHMDRMHGDCGLIVIQIETEELW